MPSETAPAPGPIPAVDPPTRPHWRLLGALTAAAFATVTVELSPAGLLPGIAADLQVSTSAAGVLVAVWAVTLATTSLFLVRLTRRVARQRVIGLALLVFGLATVATAAAPSLATAMVARVVGAAAHGLVWALLVPHAASLVPPERLGRAVSVVLAGPAAATVLGVPAATALGSAVGWRAAFVVLALLVLPPAWLLLGGRSAQRPEETGGAGAWWRDASMRVVARNAVATAAVLAGHFAAATYVAVLVTDAGGLSVGAVPVVLFVFGAAGVAGLAVSGPLADRRPRSALTGTAVAFAVALAGLGLLGLHPAVAFVVVVVWGFLIGLLPPVFQTRIARLASPEVRDVAGAVAISALNVGIAAGALVGGVILARAGTSGLVVAAAVLAAAGAGGLLLDRATRR
ncbi:MFS transporter [Blastococcus sp. TF02-8]|uniref:MFS transporter n=1 Tax=Blastococcus sp. TF02-8 TaxID=2250574 RepID=UPI000DE84DA4|nr:MFS transporter [Blastococcus sp. TF02-8]RBY97017.1 MFS transporter [Blastococcus sp. TF02-8]